jgi:hypothetical protein
MHTLVEKGGNGNVYVMFYCGFYSVDVAVAFLNPFLTVGRHGVNVCRIKTTIKCDINVSIYPPFSTRVIQGPVERVCNCSLSVSSLAFAATCVAVGTREPDWSSE